VNSFSFESRNPAGEKERFFSELRQFAVDSGWSPAISNEVELVIEEWWTNLISYGLVGQPHPLIKVCVNTNSRSVILEIEDNGMPFDPTLRPGPDLSLPLEQRPIGGLGIYMIKKLTRQMHSERRAGRNILRIEKDLTRPVLGTGQR